MGSLSWYFCVDEDEDSALSVRNSEILLYWSEYSFKELLSMSGKGIFDSLSFYIAFEPSSYKLSFVYFYFIYSLTLLEGE